MINFDEGNLTAGTVVTDQFEGLNISTPSEFGVMVFDTNNPTGGDEDLSAVDLGNVLIISEDGDSSDPDDNATGGTINIEFEELSTVTAIGLLDIEESGGFINLFDEQSNLIEAIAIEPMSNGESFELDISNSGVSRLELNLAGSGALTSLDFSPDDTSTAIQLTDTGWEQDGQQLGTWTSENDAVVSFSGIEVADTVTANTLRGDDLIFSVVDGGISLLNQGTIITGNGDDYLQGSVIGSGNGNVGIFNNFETGDDFSEFLNTLEDVDQQIINTEAGEDRIIGTVDIEGDGSSNTGILSGFFGSINTGADNDQIIGTVKVEGNGSLNQGILFGDGFELRGSSVNTKAGDDQIIGTVEVEGDGNRNTGLTNANFSGVPTGEGDDQITGTVKVQGNGDSNAGILNGEGSITAGDGDDRIIGMVEVAGDGSFNDGIVNVLSGIRLGAGNDYLYGAAKVAGDGNNNFGIYNDFSSTINMGAGDDLIVGEGGDAYTGFGADIDDNGFIELGAGDDRLVGFGANQFVDGGTGIDIAEFEFSFDDGVTLGSTGSNAIDITANEITMSFTDVEEFVFANGSFTVDELIDLV